MGLDFTTIGKAERGKTHLSLRSLDRVAEKLGLGLGELVRRERGVDAEDELEKAIAELEAYARGLTAEKIRCAVRLLQLLEDEWD